MTASLDRLQNFYGELSAELLLATMIRQEFPGTIAMLTSFGADAGLLLSIVADIEPSLPILFLDTGKHFPETLEYGKALERMLGLTNVHWLEPDPALLNNVDKNGELWKTQPNRCCWLRKVEPLNRAIESMGILALITGRKRFQTPERSNMQTIELDEAGVFRINPLATWSRDDSREATLTRKIPPHPLTAKGYKSIGCAPCTIPVADGVDERAGRWAHTVGIENEQKTECGIHVPASEMNWSV